MREEVWTSGRRWEEVGNTWGKGSLENGDKGVIGLGEVFVAVMQPSMRGCRCRGCAEDLQFILRCLRFKRCLHENFTSL